MNEVGYTWENTTDRSEAALRIYAHTEQFVKARIRKGYTQRDLAQLAGISHSYISLLERSVKSVGPNVAARLCRLLDAELDDLFELRKLSS